MAKDSGLLPLRNGLLGLIKADWIREFQLPLSIDNLFLSPLCGSVSVTQIQRTTNDYALHPRVC